MRSVYSLPPTENMMHCYNLLLTDSACKYAFLMEAWETALHCVLYLPRELARHNLVHLWHSTVVQLSDFSIPHSGLRRGFEKPLSDNTYGLGSLHAARPATVHGICRRLLVAQFAHPSARGVHCLGRLHAASTTQACLCLMSKTLLKCV